MTRAFVVVNPAAGGGRAGRAWPRVRDELVRLGLHFEAALTRAPGEATELARRAALDGWPLVVAVGGDGTLSEIVHGVTDAQDTPRAAVSALLIGRGGDAARNLGLAADWRAAARRLLAGDEVTLDLGAAAWPDGRRRYFVNSAGAGFDAAVARRAAGFRGPGTVPYLAAVLVTLARHRPVEAEVEIDGAVGWRGRLTSAVVANGAWFGGGMKIAPDAAPGDGRLDLVILGDLGRAELVRWLPSVYRGGHVRHPRVAVASGGAFALRAAEPLPVQVDGDAAGTTPFRAAVCPRALRLVR